MKKITILALILFILPLIQACVTTAFVAGAAAGGAVIYDNRSTKTMYDDRNITDTAQTKIDTNSELKDNTHISIATFNHVVLAAGQAQTAELRDKAISIIQQVPKVKRIYNEITIEPPISFKEKSNDAWLTTKIKTQLLAEKGLQSALLKVVTENSVAYLMGVVSHSQADLAANVTKNVKGVEKVVKVFEYVN